MISLYQNPINIQKFRSTNIIWNELKLNSPMSIGYVTNLIESRNFESKEEWRDYYYETGKKRLELIKKNGDKKEYNLSYGRTEDELKEYGIRMFEEIQKRENPLNITLAECVFMVKYRIMGETWNGVVMREKNTIEKLQSIFPELVFIKVDGKDDYKYGIDYEIYKDDYLISAIQIKPFSYHKGSSPEIEKAKYANLLKNELYTREKGVKVYYVYSKINGTVINKEVISNIYPIPAEKVA